MGERITRRQFLKLAGGWTLGTLTALYLPSITHAEQESKEIVAKTLDCPIHCWHEITSQSLFESYLYQLRRNRYFPISLSQIADYLEKDEINWPKNENPMVITLDDSLLSQYKNAAPVLESWHVQATFACLPDWESNPSKRYMSNAQIKDLAKNWEIASHTINHPHLPRLQLINNGAWQAEIVESKKRLEEITGRKVTSFVYPFGASDAPTQDLVSRYYRIAVKTGGGTLLRSDQKFTLPRIWKS